MAITTPSKIDCAIHIIDGQGCLITVMQGTCAPPPLACPPTCPPTHLLHMQVAWVVQPQGAQLGDVLREERQAGGKAGRAGRGVGRQGAAALCKLGGTHTQSAAGSSSWCTGSKQQCNKTAL
jgi:hypothetical protein